MLAQICIFDAQERCRFDRRWRQQLLAKEKKANTLVFVPVNVKRASTQQQAATFSKTESVNDLPAWLSSPILGSPPQNQHQQFTITSSPSRQAEEDADENNQKLISGICDSLGNILRRLSSPQTSSSSSLHPMVFSTPKFTLSQVHSVTRWRLVLLVSNGDASTTIGDYTAIPSGSLHSLMSNLTFSPAPSNTTTVGKVDWVALGECLYRAFVDAVLLDVTFCVDEERAFARRAFVDALSRILSLHLPHHHHHHQ